MQINLAITGEDVLEFVVEQMSARQTQPLQLVDWPGAFARPHAWQLHRWDMFCVDVLVPVDWYKQNLATYVRGCRQDMSITRLRVARFFVHPEFQNPSDPVFSQQPTRLTPEDHERVRQAAKSWFLTRPEYASMVEWGVAAYRQMRDLLVLVDKFDTSWWAVFEENTKGKKI